MKNKFIIEFKINFSSPLPVYEQIKGRVKQAIAKNELTKDEKMISIRELASILKINPNTVARAYKDLEREEILAGRSGVGYTVKGMEKKDNIGLFKQMFLRLLEDAAEMGIPRESVDEIIQEHFKVSDSLA